MSITIIMVYGSKGDLFMFQDYLKQYRDVITEGNPKNGICFDGVVNAEKYFGKEKRLMFLLKETNSNKMNGEKNEINADWNYMEWVQKQAEMDKETPLYRSIFRNIAMWSKMFDMYSLGKKPSAIEFIDDNGIIINEALCKSLESIAIINLKKSWGVQQTDWNAMKAYLDNHIRKEILLYQVNELKPTFVICGGTFDFAFMVYGNGCCIQKKADSRGNIVEFFEKGETTFVKCYHPSRQGWSREDGFEHMNNIFGVLL